MDSDSLLHFTERDGLTPKSFNVSGLECLLVRKCGTDLDRLYYPDRNHSRLDKIVYALPFNLPPEVVLSQVESPSYSENTFSFNSGNYKVHGKIFDKNLGATLIIPMVRKPSRGFSSPNWFSFTFDFPDEYPSYLNLILELEVSLLDSPVWQGMSNRLEMETKKIPKSLALQCDRFLPHNPLPTRIMATTFLGDLPVKFNQNITINLSCLEEKCNLYSFCNSTGHTTKMLMYGEDLILPCGEYQLEIKLTKIPSDESK